MTLRGMTQRVVLFTFCVRLLPASFLLAQDQRSVFRGGTDMVSVPVSVRTVDKAVAGLKASDFELMDNGVVQSIQSFAIETQPIDVTLLLDLSGR